MLYVIENVAARVCRETGEQLFSENVGHLQRIFSVLHSDEVAKVVGTKKEAKVSMECVFDSITKALKKKGQMALAGFGTFKVSKRKARRGRNPVTL